MNGILRYIRNNKDIYGENADGCNLLGQYSGLIHAIMRSQGREVTMIDDVIIDTFIGGTDKGTQLLDELASAVKKFCEKLPYRYAVCKYDGCGGSTTSYWHTLDEVIDLVTAETFTDNEMFGQLPCYDLVNGENITDKIYHFIADNRKRYVVLGYLSYDETAKYETDSLDDAKSVAKDMLSSTCIEVLVYDREDDKTVFMADADTDEENAIFVATLAAQNLK
jgi:hypothetical protein